MGNYRSPVTEVPESRLSEDIKLTQRKRKRLSKNFNRKQGKKTENFKKVLETKRSKILQQKNCEHFKSGYSKSIKMTVYKTIHVD